MVDTLVTSAPMHRITITEERDGRVVGVDMMFDPALVDLSNSRMVTIRIRDERVKIPADALGKCLEELDAKFKTLENVDG